MFKQKPQEDRDSPKAAAGGKGSLLRRRWKLLAVGGCVLVAAGVLAARQLAAPAVAETTYIEVTPSGAASPTYSASRAPSLPTWAARTLWPPISASRWARDG